MYGDGEPVRFQYKDEDGYAFAKTGRAEGNYSLNLERRYIETESEFVREELRRYIAVRRSCGGARPNKSARHVFVQR